MPELPSGTVAFLFTDIEGSTKRWQAHPEAMAAAVARHDALLRQAIEAHRGYVFKTVGDAFCAAFPTASMALAASLAGQHALIDEPWPAEVAPIRVRMALHTGAANERDNDYFGPTVNRVARLLSTGYGEQILLSLATQELVRAALPAGVTLRDMGRHRLKDLAEPEHVFQVVSAGLHPDFPPLKSLDLRPNNLPQQLTPFVGREQEVAEARERLLRPDVRLLTLTGPGGTGKTRLSLQVAAELAEEFADGLFFVALDQITDPALVLADVAQAIGVREAGGQPIAESLREYLRDKQLLLVLDNFEQVTQAAPQLAQLLRACPGLKALVTSRIRLRIHGEHEHAVPPLGLPPRAPLPPPADLLGYEAVRLFVERAQASKRDFALTAENASAVAGICHDLDGLPLAIELAAARVKLLTPQALRERLGRRLSLLTGGGQDRPERQQTLRGAIAWSHDLLPPAERALFARLAVFAGGCDVEAAEAVCGPDGDVDVLRGIDALVDHSLVRLEEAAGQTRYAMLATIREFALERLAVREGGEAATRRAHATYHLALAERAEPELGGAEQGAWLARLAGEHDNLRAALTWLHETGAAEDELRLAVALWRFWLVRGHLSEGRDWLERALARSDEVLPAQRALALAQTGALVQHQGDFDRASALLEQALALYEQVGDRVGMGRTLGELGTLARDQGEYDLAEGLYEDGLAHFRALGHRRGTSFGLNWLGTLALMQARYDEAAAYFEENLAIGRELGDTQMVAGTLGNLAETRHFQGDLDRAEVLYHEALSLFRDLGDRHAVADFSSHLARLALARGEVGQARELLMESLTLAQEVGDKVLAASCLEALAGVIVAEGAAPEAARLLGAAETAREALGAPMHPTYQGDHNRYVAAVRGALDPPAFATAWAAGRALSLDQAVALALPAR